MKRSEFLRWLGLGMVGLWTGTPLRALASKRRKTKVAPVKIPFYACYVRGTRYGDYRRIRHQLKKGMPVELRREPDNPYDRYAIGIWWKNYKLGYIPAVENVALAGLMDAGIVLDARISKLTGEPYREVKISVAIKPGSKLEANRLHATQRNDLYRGRRMRITQVEAWPEIESVRTKNAT